MSFSVVLGHLPEDIDSAVEYIESLLALEKIDEVIFSFSSHEKATVNGPIEGDDIARLENSGLQLHEFPELHYASGLLNLSVALARNDRLLVLEEIYRISGGVIDAAEEFLRETSTGMLVFERLEIASIREGQSGESFLLPSALPNPAFATSRKAFLEIRGYDESFKHSVWIGQDLKVRYQRLGLSVASGSRDTAVLIDTKHLPSTWKSASGKRMDKQFASIMANQTIFRNLLSWSVPQEMRPALVSVAIATKNRAEMLKESLNSVLYQDFQEFEIVVVDDGSDDPEAVRSVVDSISDPRIRLIRHPESLGVAAARNDAADATECILTAVHDDDDIMLPWRLRAGIEGLAEGVDATFGGWINFHHDTGELTKFVSKKQISPELVAGTGAGPGHSTWTLPTKYVKAFRYNTKLSSSVDHELATRLANSGVNWQHVDKFMYLRRVHEFQITAQDSDNQKAGHTLSKLFNTFLTNEAGRSAMAETSKSIKYASIPHLNELFKYYGGFLPDHLVVRNVVFSGHSIRKMMDTDLSDKAAQLVSERDMNTGRTIVEQGHLADVTQEELVMLRKLGLSGSVVAVRRPSGDDESVTQEPADQRSSAEIMDEIADQSRRDLLERFRTSYSWVASSYPKAVGVIYYSEDSIVPEYFDDSIGAAEVRRIIISGEFGESTSLLYLVFSDPQKAVEFFWRGHKLQGAQGPYMYASGSLEDLLRSTKEMDLLNEVISSPDDSGLVGN